MTDTMKVTPPRFPSGYVTGEELNRQLAVHFRDVLSRFDIRYANNDFNGALVANGGVVTVGNQAIPTGHTAGIPTLTSRIADNGQAANQKFLPQVSAGNKLSVQSALPLSSTSTLSTSTINVGAHNVQYGFGKTAYSSGSITGLTPSTTYYVYAADANYAGGAVSYVATTNPQNVVAANGNYYVGSITTGLAASVYNVSAATSANPIVITTSVANSLNTNDSVMFAGMPGDFGTNLNGNSYTITVLTGSTFSIPVNGLSYAAYTSGGTVTRANTGSNGGGGAGAGYGGLTAGGGTLP